MIGNKIVTVSNFNSIQINILNQKYILTVDNTVEVIKYIKREYIRQTKALKPEIADVCDMQLQFTTLQLCG
jgi:hypothetical protein